jgi:hypothetical protein
VMRGGRFASPRLPRHAPSRHSRYAPHDPVRTGASMTARDTGRPNHPSPVRPEPVEGQAPPCSDKLSMNDSREFTRSRTHTHDRLGGKAVPVMRCKPLGWVYGRSRPLPLV